MVRGALVTASGSPACGVARLYPPILRAMVCACRVSGSCVKQKRPSLRAAILQGCPDLFLALQFIDYLWLYSPWLLLAALWLFVSLQARRLSVRVVQSSYLL